jgi:DNA gyrase subunit A
MMSQDRPDLTQASPEIRAYIEALEAELERLREQDGAGPQDAAEPFEPPEPPTTLNVVSVSAAGQAKRTPRHLYDRQRRGGMGVFDLETPGEDPPAFLSVLDEAHDLLVFTAEARAYHLPVSRIVEAPIRARGQPLQAALGLPAGERIAAILPAGRGAALALLSQRGYARVLPAHVVGPAMTPGTGLFRYSEYGPLAAVCWTTGDGDLFVASRHGLAIRFPERALPLPGGLAIRLEAGDQAVAVEAVRPPEGNAIFLLGADGRGTIRLMSGFAANKAPGGGGKTAMKTDRLIGAVAVEPGDDLFALSRLSKIIRFRASEVPAKEGVVQGVNCMALRADECVVVTASPAAAPPAAGANGV